MKHASLTYFIPISIYLFSAVFVNLLRPDYFNLNGCTPSGRFVNMSSKSLLEKLAFFVSAPFNFIYPVYLDIRAIVHPNILRLQYKELSMNSLILSSNQYHCACSMVNSFYGKAFMQHNSRDVLTLRKSIDSIRKHSIKAGLEVLEYDSFEKELAQSDQLVSQLLEKDTSLLNRLEILTKAHAAISARLKSTDGLAKEVYGPNESILESVAAIEKLPKQYRLLDLDPNDPYGVLLSDDFKGALAEKKIDPGIFLTIFSETYDDTFMVLKRKFSLLPEGEAMTEATDIVKRFSYFRSSVLRFVSEKVQKKLITKCSSDEILRELSLQSKKFIDEFIFNPLSTAKTLEDIMKYIALHTDTKGVDPKLYYNPENYARLDHWAALDTSETSDSSYLTRPSLFRQIQSLLSYSAKFTRSKSLFSPANALLPHDITEDPWILGTSGQLSLKMLVPIKPFSFTILSPPVSHEYNPTAGPKGIQVWGRSTDGRDIHLANFTRSIDSSGIDMFKMNVFSEDNVYFNSFRLVILNNHGHPGYSKLYQFEVHGLPIDA